VWWIMIRISQEAERGMVATSRGRLMIMETILVGVPISMLWVDGGRIKVVLDLEVILAKVAFLLTTTTTWGGGGYPNPKFGSAGGGYKRGPDEREGHGDQRDANLRTKLRKDTEARRMGAGGASHCFNCNRDGHFQASCPNPPPPSVVAARRMVIDL
jgi:hypothetical protein